VPIKCIKCQDDFDGSTNRKICKKCVKEFAKNQLPFARYIALLRRKFQDVIYQFFRLQNDEDVRFSKLYYEEE